MENIFNNVGKQGNVKDKPYLSPANLYYGFLSKVDPTPYPKPTSGNLDVLFEVVPKEWLDLRLQKKTIFVNVAPPLSPASLFHLYEVNEQELVTTLKLKSPDFLIEGEWYILEITDKKSNIVGDFYDPDLDTKPNDTNFYNFQMWLQDGSKIVDSVGDSETEPEVGAGPVTGAKRLYSSFSAAAGGKPLPAKKVKPNLPDPIIRAIGVMDVGIGNCNMFFDVAGDPVAYFDTGYPLVFYRNSAPNALRAATPAYTGPILQNRAGSLGVVLSHWDWDHYRLGRIANMENLPWVVPNQPIGPAAMNFRNSLTNWNYFVGPYLDIVNIGRFVQCNGVGLNNSGIAIIIKTYLPSGGNVDRYFISTGDASFGNVPIPAYANGSISGIVAVHHGSNTHGAAANLPQPPANNPARSNIAYSYGIYQNAGGLWRRPYGFPVAAAVAAYQAAYWTNESETAEAIPNDPNQPSQRGNIRVGANTAYPASALYQNKAFSNFVPAKHLDN
jgi:hypothetical protein